VPFFEQPLDFIAEKVHGSLDKKESIMKTAETQLIYMELICTASICTRTRGEIFSDAELFYDRFVLFIP